MPDLSATNTETANDVGDVPKSAAQLKKEAKRKEKLEKFKQKQEKIQAKTQNVEKAPVCFSDRVCLVIFFKIIKCYCIK